MKPNPLDVEEDYFLTVPAFKDSRPQPLAQVEEDIAYFRKRLFDSLRIPKEYLQYAETAYLQYRAVASPLNVYFDTETAIPYVPWIDF